MPNEICILCSDYGFSGGPREYRCRGKCQFRGDIIDLIRLKHKVGEEQAWDILDKSYSTWVTGIDIQALKSSRTDKQLYSAWLNNCRQALFSGTAKSTRILAAMAAKELSDPPGRNRAWLGSLMSGPVLLQAQGKETPPGFRRFGLPAYRNSDLVMYPCTRDQVLTGGFVQDLSDPDSQPEYIDVNGQTGIYGEIEPKKPGVILCWDPLDASVIYSWANRRGYTDYPIYCATGLDIPGSVLSRAQHISLLDSPGHPLTLKLGFQAALSRFPGITANTSVCKLRQGFTEYRGNMLGFVELDKPVSTYYNAHLFSTMSLMRWFLVKLEKLRCSDSWHDVVAAINSLNVTPVELKTFVSTVIDHYTQYNQKELREKPAPTTNPKLITIDYEALGLKLEELKACETNRVTIGSGAEFRLGETGLYTVPDSRRLTNFNIKPEYVLRHNGQRTYCARVYSDDFAADVKLNQSDLVSALAVRRAVQRQIKTDTNVYVYTAEAQGFRWHDIVESLSAGKPEYDACTRLGYQDNAIVFPGVTISANETRKTGFPVESERTAVYAYQRLVSGLGSGPRWFRSLLGANEVSETRLGVLAGLSFITAAIRKQQLNQVCNAQLVFSEQREDEWQLAFQILCQVLMGTSAPQSAKVLGTAARWAPDLQGLPVIIGPGYSARQALALADLNGSFITRLSAKAAVKLSNEYTETLCRSNPRKQKLSGSLAVSSLSSGFPALLSKLLAMRRYKDETRDAREPQVIYGYRLICKALGAQDRGLLDDLIAAKPLKGLVLWSQNQQTKAG
jgi:hypothetical protein